MTVEGLKYDALVEDALRGVVRQVLAHVAERGLPGDHHFYISFRTGHPGVDIPEHLRARYPNEMTVVLQYQFWGLEVGPEAFGVTLSFSEVPERLTIPFAAVTAFADPSVRFGLQFDAGERRGEASVRSVPAAEQTSSPARADKGEAPERGIAEDKPAREPVEGTAAASDKVVPLDTFRKK